MTIVTCVTKPIGITIIIVIITYGKEVMFMDVTYVLAKEVLLI